MTKLSPQQIATVARAAGFTGSGGDPTAPVVIAVAIALAESGGDAAIISPPNKDGSVDRGLWQLNSRALANISDAQALDPAGAARVAYDISAKGTTWKPWRSYTTGAYVPFIYPAQGGVLKADLLSKGRITADGNPTVPSTPGPFDPLSGISGFLGALSDPHTWLRVLYVVGGASLVLVGISSLINVPSVVASASPIGRVAKAIT